VASIALNIRNRQTSWLSGLAVVCLVAVLLSATVQSAHFCGLIAPDTQTALESSANSSGNPVCLICLMAPSISAIILLVAFFIMSGSPRFIGDLYLRPKPILESFRLYIRPPPFDLA
jgi:hypothetical protein